MRRALEAALVLGAAGCFFQAGVRWGRRYDRLELLLRQVSFESNA